MFEPESVSLPEPSLVIEPGPVSSERTPERVMLLALVGVPPRIVAVPIFMLREDDQSPDAPMVPP